MEIKEGILFKRASIDQKRYFKNMNLLKRRLCFLAYKDDKIIGTIEFRIHNRVNATIEHINISWEKREYHLELMEGFIQEFLWWNEYINKIYIKTSIMKKITLDEQDIYIAGFRKEKLYIYSNPNPSEIFKIKLAEVCPSQLTVEKNKLNQLSEWVKSSEDIICTFIKINGKSVCIDGHTRLVYSFLNNFKFIYGIYSKDCDNSDLYEETLRWCKEDGILTVEDLLSNIVDKEEHHKRWISRCSNYLNSV
ncbi:hypothetical protein [Oceanirhabdus sp. W0125-5]|uniref:hypothetical protein n=1 Tax=Oceanirhabdus sp. W0125-5 TaxID=2999116 RepID=UPI0022F2EAEB|nr:hypothetical protein [Oceanirhabdus sp. W0125-5]WBW99655.1 hypothetical protein OW730_13165 [Oceanirhabdus sp. W0125-5]